ncbi:HutD family protein [Fluviicola taffensis]|uniref:HutD-family protein n=1 Tax=Fluviicola taffensis (strain DSM 16823 / NCIMB 13979 / RW262) TaxID=755732 RepID=F2ICB2_FLUTR|nr:HutD family protein [Fluviicola taffensis]AEA44358.1 HutD-family protein [Fluviicola taffensis DSM 16823]
MKIIKNNQFKVAKWAGGVTTELFIFPENASVTARDFDWRISSAVVEEEESDFSLFEGYERILIPLTGDLEMIHQIPTGELIQKVSKFELARFDGNWQTKGKGKLTDFNFIFKSKFNPKVELIFGKKNLPLEIKISPIAFYLYEGSIQLNNECFNSPVLMMDFSPEDLIINCLTDCIFVCVQLNAFS